MHVANVVVTNKWDDLEELISTAKGDTFTFDSTKNYYLVNGGENVVHIVNASAKPTSVPPLGVPLAKFEQCGMKLASGDVYVSTETGAANLHIEVEG